MKRTLTLILLFAALAGRGQVTEPTAIVNSFNCPQAFAPLNPNMVTMVDLPVTAKLWRTPGGTYAKDFKINQDQAYFTPNPSVRDFVFSKYKGYNKKNNYVWPFLRLITADLTKTASVQLVIGMSNDYINPVRAELIQKYLLLDSIKTYEQFMASPLFSPEWKAIVKDKMDLYYAYVNNGVSVPAIELNNESFMDDGQGLLKFTGNYDKLIWSRTYNAADTFALVVHNKLSAFYSRIYKDKDPQVKIIFPLSEEIDGAFRVWNRYFLKNATYVDGFAFHPYCKGVTATTASGAYSQALTQRNNYHAYFENVVLPLIGNKLVAFSEWSSSENVKILQGTDYDRLLYISEVNWMKSIPNVYSNHYHGFSNNSTYSAAVRMNGFTKAGGAILNPVGLGYVSMQK